MRSSSLPLCMRLLILACLMLSMHAYAQQTSVMGTIKDTASKPVEGASISLLRATDSVLSKTAISDNNGRFVLLNVTPGAYRLAVFGVGFAPYLGNVITVAATDSLRLDDVNLHNISTSLKEVVLVGKKNLVEQQGNKVIVNVDAFITNDGNNVLEILEKSPGVSVDKDGNVNLKGKQGTLILIDGKPSYVTGADLANLLKGMNASQLSQIEIMSNPGAKYDASGNAGAINIKTKKNASYGFNGTLSLGYLQGSYWRTNNSLALSYRDKKVNMYLNYGFNISNGYTKLDIHRKTFDEVTGVQTLQYDQPSFMTFRKTTNNLKVGMDYSISSKTTIGIGATGQLSPMHSDNESDAYFKAAGSDVVDSTVTTQSHTKGKWKNGAVNLNLRSQLGKEKSLAIDGDYIRYSIGNDQQFANYASYPGSGETSSDFLRGHLPVNINIYSGKADYSQTFSNELKMEAGAKTSLIKTNNLADYSYQQSDGTWSPDYSRSNNFLYKENIHALYVSFSREFKKWSLQAGLRYEYTKYDGHQLGNPEKKDSTFTRHYDNFFPTVLADYKINENNTLSLSLGRRINRPAYQDLNPFLFFINKYTYQAGNPYLLPQYASTAELSYNFKDKFTVALNYSDTKNYFTQIFRSEDNVSIYTQDNLAHMRSGDISFSAQLEVVEWWDLNLTADGLYKEISGSANGNALNTSAFTARLSANNQFRITKGLTAELSAFYDSRDIDGQLTTQGLGQVAAGVSKQLFKDKATIKLSIRDVFYTQVMNGTILYNNVEEKFRQSFDSRVGALSFTYRFGKAKGKPQRSREGSATDEQERVKTAQ